MQLHQPGGFGGIFILLKGSTAVKFHPKLFFKHDPNSIFIDQPHWIQKIFCKPLRL